MSRDRGNTRIISMIKGMDLKRFTSREIILYKRGLGLSPPGAVEYRYVPRGNPIRDASAVAARVI
jgi:hypothetical protein